MIEIHKATDETLNLLYTVEDRRLDSEQVLVRAKGGAFQLDYKPLPGALWRMGTSAPEDGMDLRKWLLDPERDAYLAWLDERLAGQLLVEVGEYGLARVRDLRVSLAMRRRGVGEALLSLAEQWARAKHLVGLCAEVEEGNAGACQFLTARGFVLGGVDTLRYAGRQVGALQAAGLRESALIFYRFFK